MDVTHNLSISPDENTLIFVTFVMNHWHRIIIPVLFAVTFVIL